MKEFPFADPLDETILAIDAVTKAAKLIMKIYQQNFSTLLKEDKEPVTEADIQSNAMLQKILSRSGYPILSEESVDDIKRLDHKKVWIVDPLDGTTDFVNKTGEFTIMIALVECQKPILGLICCPVFEKLFLAQKGKGAYQLADHTWKKITVSNVSELEQCRAVGSRFHISKKEQDLLEKLHISKFTSKGSSLKVTDICSGQAELYLTTTDKMKQWDTCASYCLVTESGGKMTDMSGQDLYYNTETLNHKNGLLVTNGKIHDKIIEKYEM